MVKLSKQLIFFITLAKLQAKMSHSFDAHLGGIGMNEFIILYHLSEAKNQKLRRIDLAEKLGITASGVTRMLAPMEKVGFIKSETPKEDARVRYVTIAPGGSRMLIEAMEDAQDIAQTAMKSLSSSETTQLLSSVLKLAV